MGFVKHEQNQCPILNAKQFQKISTEARTLFEDFQAREFLFPSSRTVKDFQVLHEPWKW